MARKTRDPQSRQRIIEAAWRAIAELGLKGATVRAIAAEAGVSTGYVTHYFDDKAQLVQSVLDHNNLRAGMRVAKAVEGVPGVAGVMAAAEALLPLDKDRRTEWQVWAAFWGVDSATGIGLAGARTAVGQLVAAALEQAMGAGELPSDLDHEYEADRLLAMVAGIGMMLGATANTATTRRLGSRMLADHVAGLRAGAHVA